MTTDFEDILVNIRSKSGTKKFRTNQFFKIKFLSWSWKFYLEIPDFGRLQIQSCLVMISLSKLGL